MHETVERTWSRVLVILTLVASTAFGAVVGVAYADHSHVTVNVWHGFVHGDSMTDGSFHARTRTGDSTQYPRGCQIDSAANPNGVATEQYGDVFTTCDIWSGRVFSGTPTECYWRAETYSGRAFPWHHNRPDNYCG